MPESIITITGSNRAVTGGNRAVNGVIVITTKKGKKSNNKAPD